jgi:hypothetical protein
MEFHSEDGQVDAEFLSALKEKYKISNIFCLENYDRDFNRLRQHLQSLKKEVYDPNDRIIVVQFDTDYYIDERVGINLINLFTVWKEIDIPLWVMIYYTNHIGVSQEIDHICRYSHVNDRPTVIETFFNPLNYVSGSYPTDLNLDVESIKYHALCMMGGTGRSHRFALYNHIKHLATRMVLTFRGVSQ